MYGVAAARGLLPGGTEPSLLLFDIRHSRPIDVSPDAAAVERRVAAASALIAAGDFRLGPEHADRPCAMCAFRPICKDARTTAPAAQPVRLPGARRAQ
jgi:hypothetical protein